MFFLISKIASLLFLPYPFFYLLGFFGLLAYRRRIKGRRPRWPLFMYLLFGLMSVDVVANFLMQTLEDRFPHKRVQEVQPVDAAFVLGAISNPLAGVDEDPQFRDGVDRLLVAVDLFKAGKVQYIILTGKSSLIDHKGVAESEELKAYLVRRGFPADRILVDAESRNTAENFQYGLDIAARNNLRSFYLITSAFHMYRSVLTYEKVLADHFADKPSFTMTPFPVDYRSDRIPSGMEQYFPAAHSAFKSSIALKEYMGLLAYAARGYIGYRRLLDDFRSTPQ